MAVSSNSKLIITFTGSNGDAVFSFDYADTDANISDIRDLVNGIITNGSIFQNVPLAFKSAKFVTTETTTIDLSV